MKSESSYYIHGVGAVSPAGWDLPSLLTALRERPTLPLRPLQPPGAHAGPQHLAYRVPTAPRLPCLQHARIRRTSSMTWFAAAAGLEALGPDTLLATQSGTHRLGLVCAVMNACVQYSSRFYGEVLRDPATASPILFPETVFNAPTSHLAVLCGASGAVTTVIGGRHAFLSALDQASLWLDQDLIDSCLVVCAEEADWLSAEALIAARHTTPSSEGAAALHISRLPGSGSRTRRIHLLPPPGAAPGTEEDDTHLTQLLGESFAASAGFHCAAAAAAPQPMLIRCTDFHHPPRHLYFAH